MGFLFRNFQGGQESELEDITRNLGYILSAKRDGSAYFPDFGLSEPTHRSAEEAILRYTEEIRSAIARYEPRVVVVEIDEDYEGEDGRGRLLVRLKLRRNGEAVSFSLEPRSKSMALVHEDVPGEDPPSGAW